MSENFNTGDITKNRKAKTGFLLGILGLVAWIIPLVGAPITVTGLIFSIKGTKSLKRKLAIAVIVLSSIGLFLTIVNGSIGAYQGLIGQNYIVNKFIYKKDPNLPINYSSKTEIINQAIKELKENLPLPYKLDRVTTIVDITAEPEAIRYHYIISGLDTSKITNDLLKKTLTTNICSSQNIRNILSQDINMEYSYSVENSTQNYLVSFTKTDCE